MPRLAGNHVPSCCCFANNNNNNNDKRRGSIRGYYTRIVSIILLIGAVTWLSSSYEQQFFSLKSSTATQQPLGTVRAKTTTTTTSTTTSNATIDKSSSLPSSSLAPPPPPLHIWQTYVRQHGTAALQADNSAARQFLIVPYWCPDRAGNVLLNLANSLAWAVLLNRTALLHWVDDNPAGNTREECDQVLPLQYNNDNDNDYTLAEWDDWHDRLDLQWPADVQSIPLHANRIAYDKVLTAVLVPQIPDIYHKDDGSNLIIYRNQWDQHPLTNREYLQALWRDDAHEQHRAFRMLGWGMPYWYGLLLRHVFAWPRTIAQHVTQGDDTKTSTTETAGAAATAKVNHDTTTATATATTNNNNNTNHHIHIVVHSRHIAHADDGSYVTEEVQCLTHLLANYTTATNCTVALLSDRRETIVALRNFIHARYPACRVVTTQHDTVDTTRIAEHGPFAGAGFVRDLAMATSLQPVTALVGDWHRSSFNLLYDLVVYDTFRNQDGHAVVPPPPRLGEILDVPVCALTPKSAAGYSYGAGTPTFVRNPKRFPALPPVQALQDYQQQQQQQQHASSWLVVERSCLSDDDTYAHFVAAVVVAILSERQLVWTGEPCRQGGGVLPSASWLPSIQNVSLPVNWNATTTSSSSLMELTQPGAKDQAVVTLSPASLERLVDMFRRGNVLRPNQGGGRRPAAEALFAYGPTFLFGFLATQIWTTTAVAPKKVATLTASWTVGMDARRLGSTESVVANDVLSSVQTCFQKTLANRTRAETCQIVLVQETKDSTKLSSLVESQFNCSVLIVETQDHQLLERTLATVGQVRQGWIGAADPDAIGWRIRERIEWERIQAIWRLGKFPMQVPSFVDCAL